MVVLHALTVFIALYGTLIAAQHDLLGSIPPCAAQCFAVAFPSTNCSPEDIACLCADTPFLEIAAACNAANCTVVDMLQATNETYAACAVPARDQSQVIIGVTAPFGALALLVVAMRLADRARAAKSQLGYDDLFIGLAGTVSVGYNVPVIVAARLGFGRDIWSIPTDSITLSLKWLYVAYISYVAAECLCQVSILAFYLRIMSTVQRKTKFFVWLLMGFAVGFGLANTLVMIWQCKPIRLFWVGWRNETPGECIDMQVFSYTRAGIQIVNDLAILIMPLPILAKLNMPTATKIKILPMFLVGFVITTVSCLRLWALVKFAVTQNPTYDNASGIYWCATEANLFIIVACMPAMHSLVHKAVRGGQNRSTVGYRRSFVQQDSTSKSGKNPEHIPGAGVIQRSTEWTVYHSERVGSDVELVRNRS